MKKIFTLIAAMALTTGALFAQDLNEATETFNNALTAFQEGNKASALESFNKALTMAKVLGEDGAALVSDCQGTIPKVLLSMAKDLIKEGKYDEAVAKLNETATIATEYKADDVAEEAEELVPQVLMQKGNGLLKTDPAAAAAVYQQILDTDPTNGVAALRLGAAYNAAGKADEAIKAFELAAANGQEATAKKQLSNVYLKQASSLLKEKKYADAVAAALKCNECSPNPTALQIAGQASQLDGKNSDAIKYFSEYLEAAPTAKNAGQIAYTVGALYQQAGNNTKAKEYYQKAMSDPKYGAEAKKLFDALK